MFVARPIFARADEDDSAHVPVWVPELGQGLRADVYPVGMAPAAELRLDRAAVTGGYAERKLAYEFSSCITGNPEPLRSSSVPAPPVLGEPAHLQRMLGKIRAGVHTLRRARPSKLQRRELSEVQFLQDDDEQPSSNANAEEKKRALFPFQKPSASSSLEEWFNRLSSGGEYSTASLCAAVPLGPAIVRAAGKVLEMMATRTVPTQRAAWYIRIAVLNECVKQVRPDRPPPSHKMFWTKQLCNLLKSELDAIRARKSGSLGKMDRVQFWDYVLDLARWQADEALLENHTWLSKICTFLRAEVNAAPMLNSDGVKICLAAVQRFLPQILATRALKKSLRDALKPAAAQLLGAAHVALHNSSSGSTPKRSSRSNGAHQTHALAETGSSVVFNKATVVLASMLGNVGAEISALRKLCNRPPKKFTAEAAVEKAIYLVVGNIGLEQKSEILERGRVDVLLSHIDATVALERFPVSGNTNVLRLIMRAAFAHSGGDRAAVEHVCNWALSAKPFDVAHVVTTAATAIEILAQGSGIAGTAKSKDSLQQPTFHREIWLFLKELDDKDDDLSEEEEREEDRRVAALIARLCRVGVFSLTTFVRDVARIPSNPPNCSNRLVRYVQLLPEPAERTSADARRALLRRHGMLHTIDEQTKLNTVLEKALELIRRGDEMSCIREGAKLRQSGNPGAQLTVATAAVEEMSEVLKETPEKLMMSLRPMVSFLRAAGTGGLAVDFLLNCLSILLAITAQADGARPQGIYAAIVVGIECFPHLAPLLAATNQLTATISLLVRVWNVAVGNAAQQRIRSGAERSALMIGKYFCSCSPMEHEQWKQVVLQALPLSSFAQMKPLFCGLVVGMQSLYLEKHLGLTTVQAFMAKSSALVQDGITEKIWMGQGIDTLMANKKSNMRKALIERMSGSGVDRLYKELNCINHIVDGVIILVLRVSERLNAVAKPEENAYRNAIDNISSILKSTWMTALGDEMRPYSLIEVIALLLVGAMANYSGARDALEEVIELPWIQRLVAVHGGKIFFERMLGIVREFLPPSSGFDEDTITVEVCNVVARLCGGAVAEMDASSIVSDFKTNPAGVTQMLFCSALKLAQVRGLGEEFARKVTKVVVERESGAETTLLTRMLLRCYDEKVRQAQAAQAIALEATECMAESLKIFIRGVTAHTRDVTLDNRRLTEAWMGLDEARRAMVVVAAPYVMPKCVGPVVHMIISQMDGLAIRMEEATKERCIPRDKSPLGRRTAGAIEARIRLLLALSKRTKEGVDGKAIAISVAKVLACTAYLLGDEGIGKAVELLGVCVSSAAQGKAVREVLQVARPMLERSQWRKVMEVTGESGLAGVAHSGVVARGVHGEVVDNWYLLEGYGRGEEETAAVPPPAFDRQTGESKPSGKSVRLKRTYSTFACLVR